MHPILSAWLAYVAQMDTEPSMLREPEAWAQWLQDGERLFNWFYVLRKLPESAAWTAGRY